MKKLQVYVDTSVLGGCFEPEFAPWSNGLVADFRAGRFTPILSALLETELRRAPEPVRTVHGFKHVVRFDKIRLFNAVNLEQGYKPLSIHSPREVATYEADPHQSR